MQQLWLKVFGERCCVSLTGAAMAATLSPNSAEQPVTGSTLTTSPPSSAGQPDIPILEVAFRHNMWWSLPVEMSAALYENYMKNQDAGYTWDWGDARSGSWTPDGENTSINRYQIDFLAWEQRNLDNDRRRSVRFARVPAESVMPKWSGQIPQ